MYQNSEEYTDEVISKFPHMYKRDKESNNYFLLKLYLEEIIQLKLELSKLFESLDLTTAKGFVVDKFGNTFNLRRNDKETDENFKIRILAEISKLSFEEELVEQLEEVKTVEGIFEKLKNI